MVPDVSSGTDGVRAGRSSVKVGIQATLHRWFRPYFTLAVVTFLIGAGVGAAATAVSSPTGLRAVAESLGSPQVFPDRLTTWTIFSNNVVALGVLAMGAVTFGATTLFGLLFNGLLLGTVLYLGAADGELLRAVALILPHGLLELGALFGVSAIAYRIAWRMIQYLRGQVSQPLTRRELKEAVGMIAGAIGVLAVAAWIEATLTVPIARALLG